MSSIDFTWFYLILYLLRSASIPLSNVSSSIFLNANSINPYKQQFISFISSQHKTGPVNDPVPTGTLFLLLYWNILIGKFLNTFTVFCYIKIMKNGYSSGFRCCLSENSKKQIFYAILSKTENKGSYRGEVVVLGDFFIQPDECN